MKAIVKTTRPPWVDDAIERLDLIDRAIVDVQDALERATLQLRRHGIDEAADDLNEAFHDSEHLWKHVTSLRRGLRMSWPDGDPEDRAR